MKMYIKQQNEKHELHIKCTRSSSGGAVSSSLCRSIVGVHLLRVYSLVTF